jgi:hypothetical protein
MQSSPLDLRAYFRLLQLPEDGWEPTVAALHRLTSATASA